VKAGNLEVYVNAAGPFPGSLTVETETIDITSGLTTYKPDPKWEHVDKAGHWHAFTSDGKHPTLEDYVKLLPCPGGCGDPGCEGTRETRYRCRICGKRIKPGFVVDSYPGETRSMPGRTSWSATVEQAADLPIPTRSGELLTVRAVGDGFTYFGLATIGPSEVMSSSDGVWMSATFYGIGELGRRR
jgi:hypothetical protein